MVATTQLSYVACPGVLLANHYRDARAEGVPRANAMRSTLYLFTNDRAVRRRMIRQTLSGGVEINDCAVHVAQHDLPFGGVGRSGMGQYHAEEGFLEFFKLRPVFTRAPRTALALMPPPTAGPSSGSLPG